MADGETPVRRSPCPVSEMTLTVNGLPPASAKIAS
jgi:hypothetical protein